MNIIKKKEGKKNLLILCSEAKNKERNLQREELDGISIPPRTREVGTTTGTQVDIFLQPINTPFRVDARKRHAVQSMISKPGEEIDQEQTVAE